MTSPASARCSNRRAFTLTEVLVVIGIMVLIAGLLLPLVMKAYRQGGRTRTAADLQTIAMALEAYKAEFGDYPDALPVWVSPTVVSEVGFAMLGKTLASPGYATHLYDGSGAAPAAADKSASGSSFFIGDIKMGGGVEYVCVKDTATPPPSAEWQQFSTIDGAGSDNTPKPDGSDNGFRMRAVPGSTDRSGRIYGPYIPVDKFKVRGMALLDRDDKPILYMRPARIKPASLTAANSFVGAGATFYYDTRPLPIALFYDTTSGLPADAVARINSMLGDYNKDGDLDSATETEPAVTGYILWCAGTDGVYGPPTVNSTTSAAENRVIVQKCDDVLNFTR